MSEANSDIIKIIGPDNFAKLVEAYGATQVYIPKNHECGAIFFEVLGDEVANKLFSLCGGSVISLPINYRNRIKARNIAIYTDSKAGANYSKLSIKYNLTSRQLRTIIAKCKIEEAKHARNKSTAQTKQ